MNTQALTDLAPLVALICLIFTGLIAVIAMAGIYRRSTAATWLLILFALLLGATSSWLTIQTFGAGL